MDFVTPCFMREGGSVISLVIILNTLNWIAGRFHQVLFFRGVIFSTILLLNEQA